MSDMSDTEVMYKYVKGKGWVFDREAERGSHFAEVKVEFEGFETLTAQTLPQVEWTWRMRSGPTVVVYPRSIMYMDGI